MTSFFHFSYAGDGPVKIVFFFLFLGRADPFGSDGSFPSNDIATRQTVIKYKIFLLGATVWRLIGLAFCPRGIHQANVRVSCH